MQTLRRRWNFSRFMLPTYISVCFGLLVGLATTPYSGFDYNATFDAVARGCETCAYYPYHFSWFLRPLGIFADWKTAYIVWMGVCFVLLWFITKAFKGNPLIPLLAGTSIWNWWLGQVDVIPLAGVLLAWIGTHRKQPLLVSLAFVILSAKPQVGLLPMLLFLWWNRDYWLQLFIFPVVAALISFAAYGLDWPLRWLRYTPDNQFATPGAHYVSNPALLLFLPGVALMRTRLRKLQYIMTVVCCAVPFVGAYSYFLFLVFEVRWWEVLAGYIGLAAAIAVNSPRGLVIVIAQPVLILVRLLYTEWRARSIAPVVVEKAVSPTA